MLARAKANTTLEINAIDHDKSPRKILMDQPDSKQGKSAEIPALAKDTMMQSEGVDAKPDRSLKNNLSDRKTYSKNTNANSEPLSEVDDITEEKDGAENPLEMKEKLSDSYFEDIIILYF